MTDYWKILQKLVLFQMLHKLDNLNPTNHRWRIKLAYLIDKSKSRTGNIQSHLNVAYLL